MASGQLYIEFTHDVPGSEDGCEAQHERAVDHDGDERGAIITWDAPVPQVCPHCGTRFTAAQFAALDAEWERARSAELDLLDERQSPGLAGFLASL